MKVDKPPEFRKSMFIPHPFRRREQLWTFAAIAFGLLVTGVFAPGCSGNHYEWERYVGWDRLAVAGCFIFLAFGGRQRPFYVAVFGTVAFLGMAITLGVSHWVQHKVPDSFEVLAFIVFFFVLLLVPIALALGITYLGRNWGQVLETKAVNPATRRFASLTISKSGVVLLCLALCLAAWSCKAEPLMGLGLAGLAVGGIIRESLASRRTRPSTSVIFSRAVNKKLEMPVNTG